MTLGDLTENVLSPFCIKCTNGQPSHTKRHAISIPNLSFSTVESVHRIEGDLRPVYITCRINDQPTKMIKKNHLVLTTPNVASFADSSDILIFHNASCC